MALLRSTASQSGPFRDAPRESAEMVSPEPSLTCAADAVHPAAISAGGRQVDDGQPGQAFYRLRATAALDASAVARILQCFVRSGQIPHLFLATRGEGEIRIEVWLSKTGIELSAMRRIAGNIEAIVSVISVSLEYGDDSPPDAREANICQAK